MNACHAPLSPLVADTYRTAVVWMTMRSHLQQFAMLRESIFTNVRTKNMSANNNKKYYSR